MKAVWGEGDYKKLERSRLDQRRIQVSKRTRFVWDTLLKGPLVKWWLGEACGETLVSAQLGRKH